MTFDDDFVRINLGVGTFNLRLRDVGLEWPPPERAIIDKDGTFREATDGDPSFLVMVRITMSQITDEQRAEMTHVARGAEYLYET